PYFNRLAFPPAPEGFTPDCHVGILGGTATVDARTGGVGISIVVGDGVSVDTRGRLSGLAVSSGPRFDFSRSAGSIAALTDSGGSRWVLSYDAAGRVVRVTATMGTTTLS